MDQTLFSLLFKDQKVKITHEFTVMLPEGPAYITWVIPDTPVPEKGKKWVPRIVVSFKLGLGGGIIVIPYKENNNIPLMDLPKLLAFVVKQALELNDAKLAEFQGTPN